MVKATQSLANPLQDFSAIDEVNKNRYVEAQIKHSRIEVNVIEGED